MIVTPRGGTLRASDAKDVSGSELSVTRLPARRTRLPASNDLGGFVMNLTVVSSFILRPFGTTRTFDFPEQYCRLVASHKIASARKLHNPDAPQCTDLRPVSAIKPALAPSLPSARA